MLIPKATLDAICEGQVTLAFRRWRRPTVRSGGTLRTLVGVLAVGAVEAVDPAELTEEQARLAGYADLAGLLGWLNKQEGTVYRVELSYAGADPRIALRAEVPDEAELAQIRAGLDRLDAGSQHGPWTRTVLALIARNPGVRAPDLAARLDRPTLAFKADVRKLKERGLTESLPVGYRLSPRGEAVLGDPG